MRNLSIIRTLMILALVCLFFIDFKTVKDKLISYYRKLNPKNKKKGI